MIHSLNNRAGRHAAAALALGLCALAAPAAARAAAPAGAPARVERVRWLMGTACRIEALGPGAARGVQAAFDEIERLDRVMSLYKDDSELSRLNRAQARRATPLSKDLFAVLERAAEVHRLSGGAFDPTAGSGAPGFEAVLLERAGRRVSFTRPGLRIDLGGIGKGYALDAAAAALRRAGARSALLNFGGQILAVGRGPEGGAWEARLAGSELALRLPDGASASTSSQEEQPGHILDPRSGRAVRRPGGVTVVARDATAADAWSTALFVLGDEAPPPGFDGCAARLPPRPADAPILAGDCGPYLSQGKGRRARKGRT